TYFLAVLARAAEDPSTRLSELSPLGAGELEAILNGWNATDATEWGQCAHEAFFARAAERPAAPAVECGGERLSYGELAGRASALAARLVSLGVERGDRVALCLPRTPSLVVALLAVLE